MATKKVHISWVAPKTIDADGNEQDYRHLKEYEVHHNISSYPSPVIMPASATGSDPNGLELPEGNYYVAIQAVNTKGYKSAKAITKFQILGSSLLEFTKRSFGVCIGGAIDSLTTITDGIFSVVNETGWSFAGAGAPQVVSSFLPGDPVVTTRFEQDCSDIATQTFSGMEPDDQAFNSNYILFVYGEADDPWKLIKWEQVLSTDEDGETFPGYFYDTGTGAATAASTFIDTTGAVSVAAGTTIVTGVNTDFVDEYKSDDIIYFSATKGAKVTFIESDTVMYIDRSFSTAINVTSGNLKRQGLRIDPNYDSIIYTIRNDTTDGFLKYPIELDENLDEGLSGRSNALVSLYRASTDDESTSGPTSFTGTITYTFSSGVVTTDGILNSWTATVPAVAPGSYLWVRQATASSTTTSDTIAIGEWSTARVMSANIYNYTWVKYAENDDGTVGFTDTYIEGTTKYIGYAYNQITATESTDETDYVWSLFEGSDSTVPGVTGAGTNFVFKRAATKPATPTANGLLVPTGWDDNVGDSSNTTGGDILWASKGTATAGATAYVWGDAFQVEGTAVIEQRIFSDVQASNGASPSVPSGSIFNIVTSELTINDSNWNKEPPSISNNGDTIYSCTALIYGSPSDTSVAVSWSVSTIFARKTDGTQGVTGDGVDIVFKRSANQPATPSASSGTPSGWYTDVNSVPAGTDPIWSSVGTKAAGATNYTWQTPIKIEGSDGVDGISIAELTIYIRDNNTPASPSGGTYNFSNGTITGGPISASPPWYQAIPSGTPHLWTSRAVATAISPTGTDTSLSWSAPVLSMKNGEIGATGLKSSHGYLYYYTETATKPGLPSGGTYTWGANIPFGTTPANWQLDAPAATGGTAGSKIWYVYWSVTQTSNTDTTNTPTYSTDVYNMTNFIGLVRFSGTDTLIDGNNTSITPIIGSDIYTTSTTTIDGGRITTGSITANEITLTGSDTDASDIGMLSGGGVSMRAAAGADPAKMYIGTGTWSNTNTGFYVDENGKFSLKSALTWDGSTLQVDGTIKSGSTIEAQQFSYESAAKKIEFGTGVEIVGVNVCLGAISTNTSGAGFIGTDVGVGGRCNNSGDGGVVGQFDTTAKKGWLGHSSASIYGEEDGRIVGTLTTDKLQLGGLSGILIENDGQSGEFLKYDGTWDEPPGAGGGSGTVTSVATGGTHITGGPFTTSGTISHVTAPGSKHIPTGGNTGEFLKYSASGTAVWAADNNTTYAANQVLDWTVSQGATNIHAENYTDTTYAANQVINWTAASAGTIHATNYTDTTYAANQVLDWTVSQGATNIHAENYTDTTYAANQVLDWTASQGATNIHTDNYDNNTYSSGDFDHDALTNFVGDEHIAHSGITMTAGNGLTGGGTIDATRTFAVGEGTYINVNADNIAVDATSANTASKVVARDGSGNFSAGQVTAVNILGTTDVTVQSDIRLKTDVHTIDNALDKVSDMRGVTFNRAEGPSSGVIAQELEKVAPELVKDGKFKSVAYGNLVGYLIEAIKELKDKVEELENGQR